MSIWVGSRFCEGVEDVAMSELFLHEGQIGNGGTDPYRGEEWTDCMAWEPADAIMDW